MSHNSVLELSKHCFSTVTICASLTTKYQNLPCFLAHGRHSIKYVSNISKNEDSKFNFTTYNKNYQNNVLAILVLNSMILINNLTYHKIPHIMLMED